MIIGIISPSDFKKKYPYGGTSGFVENIIPFFHHPIKLFGAAIDDTEVGKTYRLYPDVEFIPCFPLKRISYLPSRINSLLGYILNRDVIFNSGIDILYVHSQEAALPFILKKKAPVVFHQHGSGNPVTYSKHWFARNWIIKKIFDLMLSLIHERADWTIVIDRLCAEQAKQNHAQYKSTLLMNAVDQKVFKPDSFQRKQKRLEHGCSDKDYVLFFAGRLESVKRIDSLIKSVKRLKGWEYPVKLFIAGNGSERDTLYNLAKTLHVPVYFLGQVEHHNLAAYYNMSDVLILPSKMEGIPMVILEALSCGTPVVATKVGGIPDIVTCQNGILIDSPAPELIEIAVKKIKLLNFSRMEISSTTSKFSTAYFIKEIENIFLQVLSKM